MKFVLTTTLPEGSESGWNKVHLEFEAPHWPAAKALVENFQFEVLGFEPSEVQSQVILAPQPDTTSLHHRIHAAWAEHAASLPEGVMPWNAPPHLQALEVPARALDEELSKAIKESIQQWQDGIIAAVELVDKLFLEAHKPRS